MLATLIGVRIVPHDCLRSVRRYSRSPGTLVAIALAFTLAVSELAHAAQARADRRRVRRRHRARAEPAPPDRVRGELAPVAHLLVPVFFLQIGIDADVGQFVRPAVFGIAAVLLVVAIARKARVGGRADRRRPATGCSSASA